MRTAAAYIRTAFHWDSQIALGLGFGAALAAIDHHVRGQGVTILLSETAIGAAFLAVVLTAIAVFTTFFDAAYRTVLERAHDGNIVPALQPYILIGFVSAVATLAGLIGAIFWPACTAWLQAMILGVATFLAAWSVLGCASLLKLTAWHGAQRADLMRVIDQAIQAEARAGSRQPPRV